MVWRRIVLGVLAGVLLGPWASAREDTEDSQRGTHGVAARHAVVNLRALAEREALAPPTARTPIAADPPMPRPARLRPTAMPRPPAHLPSPAAAGPVLEVPSPSPAVSFQALLDDNTVIPPDTHGAVGPNHVMTVLNSGVRIQDKTGGVVSTVSLDGFWAAVSGASGAFDPKVFYDPYGGRWIFVACDDGRSATSGFLVGASQTSDPTGTWNLYKVDVDATDTVWADYPSVGFNKDWVVVQLNMFTVSTSAFVRGDTFVLDKAKLYANTGASYTRFQNASLFSAAPALTYDSSLATEYMLESYIESSGELRLWQITGAVGSETLSVVGFPTGSAWVWSPATLDFAPQLGSAHKIATNDSRMQDVVYRNGQLWAAQTIFLPAGGSPTRASVQWWEITTGAAVTQQGRLDDGSGATFYAFPSIAVNKDGDALVGYSRFSATQYASGNYAFRAAGDSANTLRDDTVLKVGEASYYKTYSGTSNRWGDYSNTVVDAANDTDFWTIQEYAATPGGGHDRWGTWWGKVVPPAATNTPPSITAGGPLARQQGSPGSVSTIATVSDTETAAGALVVTATSVPAGITVSGITNSSGTVTATVTASCAAAVGANSVTLQVMDGGGLTATADLTVNVSANTAPSLGAYPAAQVAPGGGTTVTPDTAPADNGSVTALGAAAVPAFGGTLTGNPATGVVTVANAPAGGNYTVTVTATDNCGATNQATFGLGVCGPDATMVPDGRVGQRTLGAGSSLIFGATLRGSRSYTAEFVNTIGSSAPGTVVSFRPTDGCSTGTLSTRDTASVDPASSGARRISFVAPADGFYRFGLTNGTGGSVAVSFELSETTLLSPAWSTNGSYDTYFSFQNTTNATVTGTLTLTDTSGAVVTSSPVTIPAGVTVSTNTAALGTPRNLTGTVRLVHDAPPAALVPEAAIANFSLTPAYVQPVRFQAVRESR
jgi:hypothetical protein